MFTGIIKDTGEIRFIMKKNNLTEIVVISKNISEISDIGDSISVNGVCLTIVKITNDMMYFDLSEETIRSSNIGTLYAGSIVNLEPAIGANERFGGHFVTGHVDAIGVISSKILKDESFIFNIEAPDSILRYLVKKGSIAVDGISFTVAGISDAGFSIVIIPHTANITTIRIKNTGDSVNLEVDIIGKYVEKFLSNINVSNIRDKDIYLLNKLKEEGFAK